MDYTNYLPDELLLEILSYIECWDTSERQLSLARFSAVCRQWYDVAIRRLYDSPYLSGRAYELFIRTVCPSVNSHIKPSALSGLVRELDLSHIVHQSSKSTTARLLGRTKQSLEVFIAPQASFAINCWASLSKCARLEVLDLSLVSECISFQSLNQTLRQLSHMRELYLPRCSTKYEGAETVLNVRWPPKLQHLSLSGSVSGQFLWDMLRQPEQFPPTMYSLSILHCRDLDRRGVQNLLGNLAHQLTTVELRDLPSVKCPELDGVLDWLPNLTNLTIALDFISENFGHMPATFSPAQWRDSKPLVTLTVVTSGMTYDANILGGFTPDDLCELMAQRFLGRLRYLNIAKSTRWEGYQDGEEITALEYEFDEIDEESWVERRWHYEGLDVRPSDLTYFDWCNYTEAGRRMRPRIKILKNR